MPASPSGLGGCCATRRTSRCCACCAMTRACRCRSWRDASKMSAPAVRERLQRLEEAGIVRWRIDIDPRALGFPVCGLSCACARRPDSCRRSPSWRRRMPQVTECHRVTGEDCFVMKIHIAALDELDHVLDQFLAYGQTTTSLVQSTPVAPRCCRCRMNGPCLKRRSPQLEHQLASEVTRLADAMRFDRLRQVVERDLRLADDAGLVERRNALEMRAVAVGRRPQGDDVGALRLRRLSGRMR